MRSGGRIRHNGRELRSGTEVVNAEIVEIAELFLLCDPRDLCVNLIPRFPRGIAMKHLERSSRRQFLRLGAVTTGILAGPQTVLGWDTPGKLGIPLGPYGERSPFEKSSRWTRDSKTPQTGSSFTPLQDSVGTLTPSSLHYERHHAGIPTIDPTQHRLVIHGMVDRPLSLSMADIKRLPSVTRTLVMECGGNSAGEWAARTGVDVQRSYGLASCSEWTGVPLSTVLREAGLRPGASWVIAEGADACRMERSIPLAKAMADILLAYGQNGEAIRPAQGYPLRLLIPGWEGNTNVKWLHSLKLTDQAYMARDETSKYSDLMPDGKARIFTYQMEAKSVITFPSGGQTLPGPGVYELTGLAWSGRGRIERVEITTDGGKSWMAANLHEPRLPIAFTRFRLPWRFDGRPATIASRAIDESSYVQPTREALIAVRGTNSIYHFNGIKYWSVRADGTVSNVDA
jgi:sulfane dehydrogenase subunit SoxC